MWCGSVVRPAPAFHGDGATAGRSAVSIPDINAPPLADPEIRFGGGSVFGFLKPFPFFDLHATRSESPATGFGTGSVSVIDGKGHRKSCYASSTNRYINNESVGLIIPWSKVRVLPGPPI